jgi:hypothetical protein
LHFPVLLKVAFRFYSRNRAKSDEKTCRPPKKEIFLPKNRF